MNKCVFAAVTVFLLTVSPVFAAESGPESGLLVQTNKTAEKRFTVKGDEHSFTVTGGLTKPYPGGQKEASSEFIRDNNVFLRVKPDLSDLSLVFDKDVEGGKMFMYEYRYMDLPVHFMGVKIYVDVSNRVYQADCSIRPLSGIRMKPAIKPAALKENLLFTASDMELSGKPVLMVYLRKEVPVLAYYTRAKRGKEEFSLILDADTADVIAAERVYN